MTTKPSANMLNVSLDIAAFLGAANKAAARTALGVGVNDGLLLGHPTSIGIGSSSGQFPTLQVHGVGTEAGVATYRWVNATTSASVSLVKSRGATPGVRAIVQNNDTLGTVGFFGDDGTNFPMGAQIRAEVDGTPGASDMPGRLVFLTTSDGFASATERMRINNAGAITMGGSLAVTGALSKGSGTFLIDHPLDPNNRDLAHGFVEAPRYELIYRGKVRLVAGRAMVDIDAASQMTVGTFAALTTNATVTSLQNLEGFARLRPSAIDGATFEIICEDAAAADEVAWVVIAERNDAFVKSGLDHNTNGEGRFIPERAKADAPPSRTQPRAKKGFRLVERVDGARIGRNGVPRHPEAFGAALPRITELVPDDE